MNTHVMLSIRVFICIFFAGVMLYAYIDQNNCLTAMQLTLPKLEKEVKSMQLENERIQYEIDRFESPIRLMKLAQHPKFKHLHYPCVQDVILLPEGKEE